jgi:hypothetical protein
MTAQKRSAPAAGNSRGVDTVHGEANEATLLDRLDGVQKQGNGWRARCPSCGGSSRKVSIVNSAGKVLVHCFAGCKAEDVIGAVGLTWAELFPPRHWPDSPEERRQQRRAVRESAWAAALATLATEATIAKIAAAQLLRDEPLEWEDYCRLVKASELIDRAAAVFVEARR